MDRSQIKEKSLIYFYLLLITYTCGRRFKWWGAITACFKQRMNLGATVNHTKQHKHINLETIGRIQIKGCGKVSAKVHYKYSFWNWFLQIKFQWALIPYGWGHYCPGKDHSHQYRCVCKCYYSEPLCIDLHSSFPVRQGCQT